MRTKKAGSGGVLRSVDDTCHGSQSTQNRKLAFLAAHQRYHALATAAPVGQKPPLLPSFFPTRRRQACRSASPLLPAVQSGRRHCEIRSMRQLPPRRTWVLTRSDCSPTTCAPWPPAVHDSAGKIFNFALGRETYPHAVWLPHYSRNLPAIEGSIIAQVTNDIEKGWKDMHSLLEKISNSGSPERWSLFCDFRSFQGGGRGVENETYVLRFASFCELLRRPLRSGRGPLWRCCQVFFFTSFCVLSV